MPFDPNAIQWDEPQKFDPAHIEWDDKPSGSTLGSLFADAAETERQADLQNPIGRAIARNLLGAGAGVAEEVGGAAEPVLRAIEGITGPAGVREAVQDPAFALSTKLAAARDAVPEPDAASNVLASLFTGPAQMLGAPGETAQQQIVSGATIPQAAESTALTGAANIAGLGAGTIGGGLPARLILQPAAAAAAAEAQREAQNEIRPDQQQPFSLSNLFAAGAGMLPFALMPGEHGSGAPRVAPRETSAPPAPFEVPQAAQEAPGTPPVAPAPETPPPPAVPRAAAPAPPIAHLSPAESAQPEPPIRQAEQEIESGKPPVQMRQAVPTSAAELFGLSRSEYEALAQRASADARATGQDERTLLLQSLAQARQDRAEALPGARATGPNAPPRLPATQTGRVALSGASPSAPPAPEGGVEAPTESATNHPIQEIPLEKLSLSNDVPQFKAGANAEGVVEPLGGKFDRRGVGPIQVWRRLDGSLEVISGRHRLDLARRSGEQTIPGQIYDEAQGFDAAKAATLDAELNIRDGQGKVKDYVQYFRNAPGLTEDEANARGLLARAIGKRAWIIASKGDAELVAAHAADRVTDEAATQIAQAAPNNGALQALGIKLVGEGKTIGQAANTMRAVSTFGRGPQTGDMFGFDDSAIQDATRMAQLANSKQRDIAERLAAITGASKRPELAAREGIDVKNPQAMAARIEQLRAEKAAWDDWATDPEKVAAIRDELGIKAPEPPPTPEPEPEAPPARIENAAQPDMLGGAEQRFEPPKPAEPPPPDLFGGATSAEKMDAAQRAADARLSGNETAVPMRAGEGELFAGQRPEQAQIPERVERGTEQAQPEIEPPKPTGNPITDRFNAKLADHTKAVEEYNAIPDTEGGTVLSVDTARELSPDYLADRTKSEAVHEPGSVFIKKLYAEKLAAPTPEGKDPIVMFTAGGTGAGKTSGVREMQKRSGVNPEIIYDTNMNGLASAKQKIDQALAAGREVSILYTYRDPIEALRNGALPRAMRQEGQFGSGRIVPLAEHEKTHIGAYKVVSQIAREYNGDSRVSIDVVDNSLGKGNARVIKLSDVPDPGAIENLHGKLENELNAAHRAGEISDAVYRGFSGHEPPGKEEAAHAGVRAEPAAKQPESPAAVESGAGEAAPEGAAAEASPAPPSTSIKNATVAGERIARGMDELVSNAGKTDRDAWEAAKERAASDPDGGRRLTAELIDKPRPISKDEVATLLHDRVRISNELAAAEKTAAETTGKTEAERAADLQRLRDAETERANNDLASRNAGTETALGLAARRMMARMDYSLDRVKARAAIAEGVDSWDKVPAHIRSMYEDLQAKLAEAEARNAPKPPKERKTVDEAAQERVRRQIEKLEGQIQQRLAACPI